MNLNETEIKALKRIQIATWLPARCAVCKVPYADVGDFMRRNPVASGPMPWTADPDVGFTDADCFHGGDQ